MTTNKTAAHFILFSLSLMSFSCEGSRRSTSPEAQYKSIYPDQFKLTYFRLLLSKSYNNSIGVREILSADHSGFAENILTEEDYTLIDSLTTIDNQYLVTDSAGGHRRAEGAQGKRPLRYIIEKLESKWLDSLAKSRLKINGVPGSWRE